MYKIEILFISINIRIIFYKIKSIKMYGVIMKIYVVMVWLTTVYTVYGNQTILVVLGCADNKIQQERVNAAIEFINNSNTPIILYVSGGVKNAMSDEMTEASRMASSFDDNNIEIILDEKAKNTAENFAYLKQWVQYNLSDEPMPNFVITTSDYHKNRAELLFNGIIPDVKPIWNLSKSECVNCWSDERIHIRNVHADIYNAVHIIA